MDFRILGPLEVVGEGRLITLPSTKERAVLLDLLLHAGIVVSVDGLIDALWGEPPESANVALRVHISRLRKALAEAGAEQRIVTRAPGYALLLHPDDDLDARRFGTLVARGHEELADGQARAAADTLGEALALWRGPAFAELADLPFARGEAARLEEARLAAVEGKFDADLACGRHARLAGELESLTSTYPVRERFWAQRMLALYRCGRQADALAAYRDLRRQLGEELGLDPSRELQELERAILKQAPELDLSDRVSPPRPAPVDVPFGVLTFLLTDMEGSTTLWETKPAAMSDAVVRHDALVADVVAANAGLLLSEKGEGDSTLSVFRRASDAAAAGLSLQDAFAAEPWPGGIELQVRMALHTGEVEQRDGDYFGPALNRAARLRSLADGGEVIASEVTATLLRDKLPEGTALIDRGLHLLRGFLREERVFQLLRSTESEPITVEDARAAHIPQPAPLSSARDTAFAGRDGEIEQLVGQWRQAVSGRLRSTLIVGEPGIGKTRLAAELAGRVWSEGATVLYGRCDEEAGAPYQPFVEILRPYLLSVPPSQLRADAGLGLAELVRLVPELAVRIPGLSPPVSIDSDAERLRLFDAVSNLLIGGSRRNPLLLVLDDLHWAARPTLFLLRHLLRSANSVPLFVLGTYRDTELDRTHPLADALADFRRVGGVERLHLGGLTPEAVASIVEALLGARLDVLGKALATMLHRETEGNPYFVAEVLRHLIEVGAIAGEAGRMVVRREVGRGILPEGVREVIARRLSRLSESANRVLLVAAVVGPRFSVPLLERIPDAADRPEVLLDALDEAAHAGLLAETGAEDFAFAHALVRETLQRELTTTRRLRLHRRIGHALEDLYADDRDTHLSELAHHFCEAAATGEAEKAVGYARAAAERAMRLLAYEEAAHLYMRALEVAEGSDPVDDQVRCDLLIGAGGARWRAGDVASARATFTRAAALALAVGDAQALARAALGLAGAGVALWAEMFEVNQEGVSLLEQAHRHLGDEVSDLHAWVIAALAAALLYVPDAQARRESLSAEAVAMARRVGTPRTLAQVLCACNMAILGPDTLDEFIANATEVRSLAEQLNDREILNFSCRHLLVGALQLGDLDRFERENELSAGLVEELGVPAHRLFTTVTRASAAQLRGDFATAERLFLEGFLIGQDHHDPLGLYALSGVWFIKRDQGRLAGWTDLARQTQLQPLAQFGFRIWIAQADADAGRLSEARREFDTVAASDFADVPRDAWWLAIMSWLAELCVHVGDRRRAALLYERLSPYASRFVSCQMLGYGPASWYLGMLATILERWDEAAEHFQAAMAMSERSGARPYSARIQLAHAEMLLARGESADRHAAEMLLCEAASKAAELGMKLVAEQAEGRLAALAGRAPAARIPRGLSRKGGVGKTLIRLGRGTAARLTAGTSDMELVRRFGSPLILRTIFAGMARTLGSSGAGFRESLTFELVPPDADAAPMYWTVEGHGRRVQATPGRPEGPTVTFRMSLADFLRMVTGELGPVEALEQRRMRIEGDVFPLFQTAMPDVLAAMSGR